MIIKMKKRIEGYEKGTDEIKIETTLTETLKSKLEGVEEYNQSVQSPLSDLRAI